MVKRFSNKKLFFLAIFLLVVGIFFIVFSHTASAPKEEVIKILINNLAIPVELANTPEKQINGLSYREKLEADSGMLFIFNNYQVRGFWMKEMNFPIDIIWIANGQIVGIEKNVPVSTATPLPVYYSPQEVNLVLEVNAGFSDKNNIKVGDMLKINP